jgi:N-hydroxyarylamine O-acetyltransferase
MPRRLADFAPMCEYHQTSPRSIFTRKSVCTVATADGRVTLANDRLITTAAGHREERPVTGAEDYRDLLAQHFGISLPNAAKVEKLLARWG